VRNEYFLDTQGNKDVSLGDLAKIVRGRAWLVALCVFLGLVAGEVAIITTPPTYRADGLLQIDSGGKILPITIEGLVLGETEVDTEVIIITSRGVVGSAISSLGNVRTQASPRMLPIVGPLIYQLPLPDPGLGWLRPYAWNTEKITIAALEVPEDWGDKKMTIVKGSGDSYKVRLPDNRVLEGQTGILLRDQNSEFLLRVDELVGESGREFIFWQQSLRTAVESMQENVKAVKPSRNSEMIMVEFEDSSAELARKKLHALLETYARQNVLKSSASAQKGMEFIRSQLPEAERALNRSQENLNLYLIGRDSVDLDYETSQLLQQITEVEKRLNQLDFEEEEIKSRYTVNHPKYRSLLTAREKLNEQLAQLRNETKNLPETQREVLELNHELATSQEFHFQLLNRLQELEIVQASSIGNVRILDQAQALETPVAPLPFQLRLFSMIIGAFLGLVLTTYLHFSSKGIRGAEDLEKLGFPVFAIVPHSVNVAPGLKKTYLKSPLKIIALENPFESTTESLRSLRTAMSFGIMNTSTESVLLTSATPNSGKTFLSINLAVIAAQTGQKVCLIDSDMRKCDLRHYLGKPLDTLGLSEVLSGQKPVEDVLVRDHKIPNLDIILSGAPPPNPSELLMRKSFDELMVRLGALYDLVILDSPPVLAVTDPIIIGRNVAARLIVARHMKTFPAELEAVRRTFEVSGNHLTGAILNNYVARKSDPGYLYNYRYGYGRKSRYGIYGYGRNSEKELSDSASSTIS